MNKENKYESFVITLVAVLFLPILPVFDIFLHYVRGKHNQLNMKEHFIPGIASVVLLCIIGGVSYVDTYLDNYVDTVAFLNRVLSFLLPLNLTACIAKNKIGLSKFRSMCMEFQEVAWQVKALNKGKTDNRYNNIMWILKSLPAIIKHDIRNDISELSKTNEQTDKQIKLKQKLSELDLNLDTKTYKNLTYKLLEKVHNAIAKLSTIKNVAVEKAAADLSTNNNEKSTIKNVSVEKAAAKQTTNNNEKISYINVPSVNNLFRAMNKAAANISDIQSIQNYLLPDIFFGFFYITATIYFVLLPLSLEDTGGICFFKSYVQLYVFMGMFFVGLYIQNAYRSGAIGIQTVTDIHEKHDTVFEEVFVEVFSATNTGQSFKMYSDNLFAKRYY